LNGLIAAAGLTNLLRRTCTAAILRDKPHLAWIHAGSPKGHKAIRIPVKLVDGSGVDLPIQGLVMISADYLDRVQSLIAHVRTFIAEQEESISPCLTANALDGLTARVNSKNILDLKCC
jgi:hypothetical protein